jgi:hypothetical protein
VAVPLRVGNLIASKYKQSSFGIGRRNTVQPFLYPSANHFVHLQSPNSVPKRKEASANASRLRQKANLIIRMAL